MTGQPNAKQSIPYRARIKRTSKCDPIRFIEFCSSEYCISCAMLQEELLRVHDATIFCSVKCAHELETLLLFDTVNWNLSHWKISNLRVDIQLKPLDVHSHNLSTKWLLFIPQLSQNISLISLKHIIITAEVYNIISNYIIIIYYEMLFNLFKFN